MMVKKKDLHLKIDETLHKDWFYECDKRQINASKRVRALMSFQLKQWRKGNL